MHVSYLFQCLIIFLYEFVRLKYFCRRHTRFSCCVVFTVLILAVDISMMLIEDVQNTFIMVFIIASLKEAVKMLHSYLFVNADI